MKNTQPENGLLVERVEIALRERVAAMAASGDLALPKERDLAVEYGVCLKTVRTALADLKRDHVLRTVPGKGTFIVPASERQRLILVFCRDISHPSSAMATQTISDVLREAGLPSALSVVGNGRPGWQELGFSPCDVGGVLALANGLDASWLAGLRQDGVPVVLLGDFPGHVRQPPCCHQVIFDSFAVGHLAARHLLSCGHRRILLACWGADEAWGRDVVRGYRAALEEGGVPFDPALIVVPPVVQFRPTSAHYLEALGESQESLNRLLAAPDAPTAVMHNSSLHLQAREMMHTYFQDHFDAASAVILSSQEQLENSYSEGGEQWAVAMPYRSLVDYALELLKNRRPEAVPTLLTVNQYRLWRRDSGRWRPG